MKLTIAEIEDFIESNEMYDIIFNNFLHDKGLQGQIKIKITLNISQFKNNTLKEIEGSEILVKYIKKQENGI